MNKKLITTEELFNKIDKMLRTDRPELFERAEVDYGLATTHAYPIKYYAWDTIGTVNFGSNEGIYLDLCCEGDTGNEIRNVPLGTYKTLREDIDGYKRLGDLNAEFVFATRKYVSENMDDFTWKGYGVARQTDEKEPRFIYECATIERALSLAERIIKPASRILIRDNATREISTYRVVDGKLEKET